MEEYEPKVKSEGGTYPKMTNIEEYEPKVKVEGGPTPPGPGRI